MHSQSCKNNAEDLGIDLLAMQPAMMIKTGSSNDESEAVEQPAEPEDAIPALEWTSEQQQQGVDVLMSSLEHDLSEEATPPEVSSSSAALQHLDMLLPRCLRKCSLIFGMAEQ